MTADISHPDYLKGSGIGSKVGYYPIPGGRTDFGTIVRFSERGVFVLYVGDETPKLTRAEDLYVATRAAS